MGRRSLTALVAFALVFFSVPLAARTAAAVSPDVVISQVYGGGGNSGATLTHDFIELFNRGSSVTDLTGWSVQYASATGTTWQVTNLAGAIAPGRYYLVQEAQGAAGITPLPTPDATGTIPMSATAGKVALVTSPTPLTCVPPSCDTATGVRDFVGYGSTANDSETAPAPTLSNTTAALRVGGGATDTDNNSADFSVGAPNPRNSGDAAPSVASTSPAAGAAGVALDASIAVTFSEAVSVGSSWYVISCGTSGSHAAATSGGPTTFVLDPTTDFVAGETCTATIVAAQVTDQDANDPPDNMTANHVFTFQTAEAFTCGDPATRIHQVQGSGTSTPMAGVTAAIEGIVVGDYQQPGGFSGFYLQEEAADVDADPLTSEGIFVFNTSFAVSAGDVVRLRGTVTEFAGLTEITSINALSICSSGATVPATTVSLPVAAVGDLERYEGMLVNFAQTLTATEVFNLGRFGEVSLSGVGRLYTPTAITTPGPAAIAQLAQNNRSRIILDDGNNQQNIDPTLYPQGGLSASNTLRVGDTLAGLTGVMDFRFGNYRIQPVAPLTWVHSNPRVAGPASVGGNLRVASFNVLNFFNGDGLGGGFPTARGASTPLELARQLAKEVSALMAIDADIVGLMEIENDAQPNSAVEDLVEALNAVMGTGTYAFIDTGIIGTDAIRVALIYRPGAVTPKGGFQILTSGTDPRFIDTLNRPALAQTFEHVLSGQTLTVVVNHLKSKGSACVGDPDTGDGQGNCNQTRTAAAAALVDWLASDPTGSGDPDYLLIGDLNAYTFEDPITTLTNGGFTNLVRTFGGLAAYSYVFNGESGYLDHALATSSMASQVTGVTEWHINPDEPVVLDYNVEFKSANQIDTFYDPGPYRSSDHDPVVVGLFLNSPPTANAGGPYTGVPFGTVTFSGSATDPDPGDTLTFAWDLEYDGTFVADVSGVGLTSPTHAYAAPGTYTVALRVTDSRGDVSPIATATVTISVPGGTEGKVEGVATWERGIKTKLNVDAKNGLIKGQVRFEGDGRDDESTRLDAILVTGSGATVFGAFGSITFRVDVHDGGDGSGDTIRLRTSSGYDSGLLTQHRGNLIVQAVTP
jgi:uncharacterized protein